MSGSGRLYGATYHGNSVEIGLARDAELAAIAGSVFPASTRDLLDPWSLVAIRNLDGCRTEVHALGWRAALGNTWITSTLVGVDLQMRGVSTRSGYVYRLGTEEVPGPSPELRDHLVYALHTWGFTDVGS